jgi:DNA-binding transcriptional regulator YbjK
MARRYDPDRRGRIIDAAIRVVGAKGIAGLSHRSVAAEADVPLGSTTYHFKTLDELMVAALRQAGQGYLKVLGEGGAFAGTADGDERGDGNGGGNGSVDLAGELARRTGLWLAGDRTGVELEYELYLAALRRPALRPVAAEWAEEFTALLARRTDLVTARALAALIDGICLQVLLTGVPYDEDYARAMLARLLP